MFKKFLRPQFVVIVFILLIVAVIGFGQQRANASNRTDLALEVLPTITRTKTRVYKIAYTRTPPPPPTNTPIPGPTNTRVTATPSITRTPGVACSPVNATITAPFTYDGMGQTFCWQSANLGINNVDSWNLVTLTINGTNFTNIYLPSSSYPTKINGYWYVYLVSGVAATGHFEAK